MDLAPHCADAVEQNLKMGTYVQLIVETEKKEEGGLFQAAPYWNVDEAKALQPPTKCSRHAYAELSDACYQFETHSWTQ